MSRLRGWLQIRPDESRVVSLVLGITFAMSFGGAVGGNAVEGIVFARFGTRYLPQLYIGLGILNLVLALGSTAILARGNRARFYTRLPLVLAIAIVAEWLVLNRGFNWFYPVLWLAMVAMGSLQSLIGWGLAGLVCDTRQAKRLFPLFAAAWVLAAILGGAITGPLATVLHADNLLLVWAFSLAVSFGLGMVLLRRIAVEPPPDPDSSFIRDLGQGLTTVARSRMLTWLLAAAVLFSTLYFSLTFPFARAAVRQYPSPDGLAAFFGIFQALSTGTAFVIALFVANRFYARFGLVTGVLLFPVIYLLGFGALAVLPDFPILVGFRFVQIAWLYGIANTAFHALFNVVPGERRDQARTFIDGMGAQVGTILAGLVLVAGQQALGDQELFILGAALAAMTAVACWLVQRAYRPALLEALRTGQPDVFQSEERPFSLFARDASAMHVALSGLRDQDPQIRRVAAEVISQAGDEAARDQLRGLISDSDPQVRMSAIRGLGSQWRRALDALEDADLEVRCTAAAVLLRHGNNEPARSVLTTAVQSTDEDIRSLALACLEQEGVDQFVAGLSDTSARVRRTAASGLARIAPDRAWDEVLARRHERLLLEELRDVPPQLRAAVREYLEEKAAASRRLIGFARGAAMAKPTQAQALLTESLRRKAADLALLGFSALLLLVDPERQESAINGLRSRDREQRANALEVLEAVEPRLVRPLLPIWEPVDGVRPAAGWLEQLLADDDEWLRSCAEFFAAASSDPVKAISILPLMERVLFLRKVALFEELAPADLKHIAAIATERFYPDRAVLVRQGQPGDELFIVVSGSVRVEIDGRPVATRSVGDSVGEMAVLTREPRSATLIAVGDVRVLCIGQQQFEVILRDRAEIGVAVIKTLADRLRERPVS